MGWYNGGSVEGIALQDWPKLILQIIVAVGERAKYACVNGTDLINNTFMGTLYFYKDQGSWSSNWNRKWDAVVLSDFDGVPIGENKAYPEASFGVNVQVLRDTIEGMVAVGDVGTATGGCKYVKADGTSWASIAAFLEDAGYPGGWVDASRLSNAAVWKQFLDILPLLTTWKWDYRNPLQPWLWVVNSTGNGEAIWNDTQENYQYTSASEAWDAAKAAALADESYELPMYRYALGWSQNQVYDTNTEPPNTGGASHVYAQRIAYGSYLARYVRGALLRLRARYTVTRTSNAYGYAFVDNFGNAIDGDADGDVYTAWQESGLPEIDGNGFTYAFQWDQDLPGNPSNENGTRSYFIKMTGMEVYGDVSALLTYG